MFEKRNTKTNTALPMPAYQREEVIEIHSHFTFANTSSGEQKAKKQHW